MIVRLIQDSSPAEFSIKEKNSTLDDFCLDLGQLVFMKIRSTQWCTTHHKFRSFVRQLHWLLYCYDYSTSQNTFEKNTPVTPCLQLSVQQPLYLYRSTKFSFRPALYHLLLVKMLWPILACWKLWWWIWSAGWRFWRKQNSNRLIW